METSRLKDVVFALRRRGVSEESLPNLLHDAEEKYRKDPAHFSVNEYVAGVPRGSSVPPGLKLGGLAAAFLVVCLGVQLFLSGVLGVGFGLPGLSVYYGAVLLGLSVVVFVGSHIDRKLPV